MSRHLTARTLLAALAVASVVFALVAVVLVQRAESRVEAEFAARDAATAAGSAALERMLAYEHETIEDDLESATEVMTEEFAEKYSDLAPQLVTTAQQRKVDVVASVRHIAALECGQECSTSAVRLLAFVDQHRTIDGEPGSPAALSVVLSMKRVDGAWLVDDLTTS